MKSFAIGSEGSRNYELSRVNMATILVSQYKQLSIRRDQGKAKALNEYREVL
jgi:hypothetical protein